MFCTANDVLVSITEKTKVLAQKCTQQLRTSNHSNTVKSRFYYNNQISEPIGTNDGLVAINHLKTISKSNNDMHLCDKDKPYDELYRSMSPRKTNANALRGKNFATCFHTLTGSLKLHRRRKSLPDTDTLSNTCGRNRRKSSVANIGYATTRWYVKVSIHTNPFMYLNLYSYSGKHCNFRWPNITLTNRPKPNWVNRFVNRFTRFVFFRFMYIRCDWSGQTISAISSVIDAYCFGN